MNGAEALTHLIAHADESLALKAGARSADATKPAEEERLELAAAAANAMLNTMLPIARFRCFIQIDNVPPPGRLTDKQKAERFREEFTICSASIAGIKGGLLGMSMQNYDCQITLWEQRKTGADMVSGFQGKTKTGQYRSWLKSIETFEKKETVQ